jgi:hypothetical protein
MSQQESTPLPAFNGDGNLPSGDYWPSTAEFEAGFVSVPGSSSRPQIYDGFKRHRNELLAEGVSTCAQCLLNGSFTTNKCNPEDIDLVVEIDEAAWLHSQRLQQLLSGPNSKADFFCDAYPLLVYDVNHPHYNSVTEAGRAYWSKWFGTDRLGNHKGRIWANAKGFR